MLTKGSITLGDDDHILFARTATFVVLKLIVEKGTAIIGGPTDVLEEIEAPNSLIVTMSLAAKQNLHLRMKDPKHGEPKEGEARWELLRAEPPRA